MNELFKLATLTLKDGFGSLSTLTVSVNEKDLSLQYLLGGESLSNLNIKKENASLPTFVSHGGLISIKTISHTIEKHSTRSVIDKQVNPVLNEFEARTTERLVAAQKGKVS